ncbi:1-phosphatidylinositol binding [Rhizoctonia solani]|uniref:1-phosphatidylinositol binding n=1 Tax=Rhizoctonia solani TaxID=456999 RepID=A0A8H7IL65_9AGAM|nr:1-phosphatidylinositol binding [Rhizoctonia solani]
MDSWSVCATAGNRIPATQDDGRLGVSEAVESTRVRAQGNECVTGTVTVGGVVTDPRVGKKRAIGDWVLLRSGVGHAVDLEEDPGVYTDPPQTCPHIVPLATMCLSEVLARHAHEQPVLARQPASAPSSAYSDEDLEGSVESDATSTSSVPATPDVTQPASPRAPPSPCRPAPKSLWKPDNMADECDIWTCTTRFSLFERRHHCRKCGGVFCQACSSQQTLLLDTTDLPFFYPPADLSLADGPPGPMVNSRVCDDCHALIYGRPTPSSLASQSSTTDLPGLSHSISSASSSSVPFPSRPSLSRTSSNLSSERARVRRNSAQQPRSSSSSVRSVNFNSHPAHRRTIVPEPPAPADLGVLATYPLRQPSAQCKANGGGLWQPASPATTLAAPRPDGSSRKTTSPRTRVHYPSNPDSACTAPGTESLVCSAFSSPIRASSLILIALGLPCHAFYATDCMLSDTPRRPSTSV